MGNVTSTQSAVIGGTFATMQVCVPRAAVHVFAIVFLIDQRTEWRRGWVGGHRAPMDTYCAVVVVRLASN